MTRLAGVIKTDETPQEIRDIVEKENAENREDIETATRSALVRIKRLPNYAKLREFLLLKAVRRLVHEQRTAENLAHKRSDPEPTPTTSRGTPSESNGRASERSEERNRQYGQGPRVRISEGTAAMEVVRSVYNYHIGGRTLGSLRGKDLPILEASLNNQAAGIRADARLLRELRNLGTIGPDETVRDKVSEKNLADLMRRVGVKRT